MKVFKTKKKILAVVTAVVLLSTLPFLQSCSNEESINDLTINKTNEKAMIVIASKYLTNSGGLLGLSIDKKEAEQLGISGDYYDKMLKDIDITNEEVKRVQSMNGKVYGIKSKAIISNQNVRFKVEPIEASTQVTSKYQATINAVDNSPTKMNVGPVNASFIEFKVTSPCISSAITLTVDTGFGIRTITIVYTPNGDNYGRIDLPAYPCGCKITSVTPCSDGSSVNVFYGK